MNEEASRPEVSELSYEAARAELGQIVELLERGNLPLEQVVSEWERGQALVKRCQDIIDGARARVEEVAPSSSPAF